MLLLKHENTLLKYLLSSTSVFDHSFQIGCKLHVNVRIKAWTVLKSSIKRFLRLKIE